MKILLITWACDRDDVSEPEIAYRWAREISKRHEVTLFSVSRPDRYGCVQEQFPNLSVIELRDIDVPKRFERFRAIAKPGYFLYFNKARRKIIELISSDHYDIIHHLSPFSWRYASPGYGLSVPLVRGPVAGGLQVPKLLRCEPFDSLNLFNALRWGDCIRRKLDRNLKETYKNAHLVLLAAPYVLNFLKKYNIHRYEIEVEHGLEKDCLLNTECKKSIKNIVTILFVGRVVRTKGVREAIKSIYYMKNKDRVRFRVVGDGPDLGECKKNVKKLQLSGIVTFVGWCGKPETDREFSNADIFLFPSFREPTGGVILEAMTKGLPCVACDYGGPSYMIPNKCGLLVPPSNPDHYARQIAANLDLLVDDPKLRFLIGQRALDHAMSSFDWERKMDRVDTYYNSLVR